VAAKFGLQPVGRYGPAPCQVIDMQQHMGRKIARGLVADARPVKQRGAQALLGREHIPPNIARNGRPLQHLPPFRFNECPQNIAANPKPIQQKINAAPDVPGQAHASGKDVARNDVFADPGPLQRPLGGLGAECQSPSTVSTEAATAFPTAACWSADMCTPSIPSIRAKLPASTKANPAAMASGPSTAGSSADF
jgi:hypothetical protein